MQQLYQPTIADVRQFLTDKMRTVVYKVKEDEPKSALVEQIQDEE